jgi:hypothetical protein
MSTSDAPSIVAETSPVAVEVEPQPEPAATTTVEPQSKPGRTRAPRKPRRRVASVIPVAPVAPIATVARVEKPVARVEKPVARTPRKPRAVVEGARNGVASTVQHQFTVHYRVERLITAPDLPDALRQAHSLGASEVHSIVIAD